MSRTVTVERVFVFDNILPDALVDDVGNALLDLDGNLLKTALSSVEPDTLTDGEASNLVDDSENLLTAV